MTMRAFTRILPSRVSVAKFSPVIFGGKDPLLKDLKAYWKLDEASGDRLDSVGNNHLSDAGACTQQTGIIDHAIGSDGTSTAFLSASAQAAINVGVFDWSYLFWSYFLDADLNYVPISKGNSLSANDFSYALYRSGTSGSTRLYFGTPTGTTNSVIGTTSSLAWHMLYVFYDAANDLFGGSIDNSEIQADEFGDTFVTDTFAFKVHKLAGGTSMHGYTDELGFWKRLLTADELTYLYNSGAGRTYPFR